MSEGNQPSEPGGGTGRRKRRRSRRPRRRSGEGGERPQGADSGSPTASASGGGAPTEGGPPRRSRRRRSRRSGGETGSARSGGERRGGERAPAAAGDGETTAPRRRRRRRGRGRRGDNEAPRRERPDRSARSDRPPGRRRPSAPGPTAESQVDLGWGEPDPAVAPTDAVELGDDLDDVDREADDGVAWGDDQDAPTPDIELAADLPPDPVDDPDPLSAEDDDLAPALLDLEVRNLVGVRFAPAGRVHYYDGGDHRYSRGEQVVVEGERGPRLGEVMVASHRQPHKRGHLHRVLRRPDRNDLRHVERNQDKGRATLRAARDTARRLGLPIKVFRAEVAHSGRKVRVHFTSEERADFRNLARELSRTERVRVELRQTGVRDQAKMLGGIGSCGNELCCTTWLPDFVPVSIKNAKDQGLVLNPSKVSGQCGRLKCCLVYEQETYAELRRGLPKLGKRVITPAGEGRVVEVDVLRQRIRVSLTGGESKVFTGPEVEPMFPSQKPKKPRKKGRGRAAESEAAPKSEQPPDPPAESKSEPEAAPEPTRAGGPADSDPSDSEVSLGGNDEPLPEE